MTYNVFGGTLNLAQSIYLPKTESFIPIILFNTSAYPLNNHSADQSIIKI